MAVKDKHNKKYKAINITPQEGSSSKNNKWIPMTTSQKNSPRDFKRKQLVWRRR